MKLRIIKNERDESKISGGNSKSMHQQFNLNQEIVLENRI